MKIAFGIDFDHGSWPGPMDRREAVVGEVWVGPAGLLGLLETALGIGGPAQPEALRVAALIPALRATEGFWSESVEHDAFAVARTLLRWRDLLTVHGWRGQAVAPRVEQLAAVTTEALPGFPDRLREVLSALERRGADIEQVDLYDRVADLPPMWRQVLEGLTPTGTRIVELAPAAATASGDLAAARSVGFRPRGDGSLQLVRPHGPVAAAEEVAAWLAALDDLDGVVVVSPSAVLDEALHRHGLPTIGVGRDAPDPAVLQVLPLVVALGWNPPDPQAALELVTLAESPVPGAVGWRLARALHHCPAIGGDLWKEALEQGLAAIDDEQRSGVQERLQVLLLPTVERGAGYPIRELKRRISVLQSWLQGRLEHDGGEPGPWRAAVQQAQTVLALAECSGVPSLAEPELARLVREATASVSLGARWQARAGLAAVGRPGGVVGPAGRVVWWSFDLASAPRADRMPWSPFEWKALEAVGVMLPDPGRQAEYLGRSWRQPLLQAGHSLVLVCPRLGPGGEELFPHPLWDEVLGKVERGFNASVLERPAPISTSELARQRPPLRRLPRPQREWRVDPALVPPRDRESPSGLEGFLGCSFKWALRYRGRIRAGRAEPLPGAALLLGSVAHEVLREVLGQLPAGPEQAREMAVEVFDRDAPRLAATLFMPGADAERAGLRRVVAESAHRLAAMIAASDLGVVSVEAWAEGQALDTTLRGRTDLVVGEPLAVIDLKWGRDSARRKTLVAGAAVQLAAYAQLLRDPDTGRLPAVAYFILSKQVLITTDGSAFADAVVVNGPSVDEAWRAVERAYARERQALDRGWLQAPGNPDDSGIVRPDREGIVDGSLELPAPCTYCELGALCGLAFLEAGG